MARRMLAALLLAAGAAAAQTPSVYWTARTEAGGRIVLTLAPCQREQRLYTMWTELPGGRLLHGCWHLFHEKVQVIYDHDGSRWAYDPAGFQRHGEIPAGRSL